MLPWLWGRGQRLWGWWWLAASFATHKVWWAFFYKGLNVFVYALPPHQVVASLFKLHYAQMALMCHGQYGLLELQCKAHVPHMCHSNKTAPAWYEGCVPIQGQHPSRTHPSPPAKAGSFGETCRQRQSGTVYPSEYFLVATPDVPAPTRTSLFMQPRSVKWLEE